MRKTSVYLPEALKRKLTALAGRSRRSEAELLRTAVERLVSEPAPPAPPPAEAPVPGRLVGVGVGPGASDLLTVRALAALRRASRVVAPTTDAVAAGRAEAIVRQAAPDVPIDRLVFAMSPDQTARLAAVDAAATSIVGHLDLGEEVAFITLGDPNLYSTFSSVAAAVAGRRPDTTVVTVPGVMAFQELAARSGTVLADDRQSFLVLPVLDEDAIAEDGILPAALTDRDRTVVVYKAGRHVAGVAASLRRAGRLDGAVLGELLGLPGERVAPVADVADRPASYLSAVIVPARPA
jgi:precorrin-2/cobalt-factor-2 C20-methyltransferase